MSFKHHQNNIVLLVKNRRAGDWYTIYPHLPIVKRVNNPLYSSTNEWEKDIYATELHIVAATISRLHLCCHADDSFRAASAAITMHCRWISSWNSRASKFGRRKEKFLGSCHFFLDGKYPGSTHGTPVLIKDKHQNMSHFWLGLSSEKLHRGFNFVIHVWLPGIWRFPEIGIAPKSSILMVFSTIDHLFWGTPI